MKKLIAVLMLLVLLTSGCSKESESIGIIGGADGPTSIIVSTGD